MKRAILFIAVALVLVLVLAPAVLARSYGSVAGDFTYRCPFTGQDAHVVVAVHQLDAAYDAVGNFVMEWGGGGIQGPVTLAHIDDDCAYFAGPIRSAMPSFYKSMWWYMAVRGGDHPAAVGKFMKGNDAAALVAAGSDLSQFIGQYGSGPQTATGWICVD